MSRIYLSPPEIGHLEREMLLDALDSNWIAPLGPHVEAFEKEVAERSQMPHAVALSSGTSGLHLALLAAGVGRGDRVIVPSFTFIATAAAATYVGATPVFLDSSSTSWNLDPLLLEEHLEAASRAGQLPAAVVTVDLYGEMADYERIVPICERFGVPLVEDAAEALGAKRNGKPAGSFGMAAVFSFNGNKIITTSGGGMVVSSSAQLAARVRHLATQAREPTVHYEHLEVGFNYRLSNLLAALGRAQLAGLDAKIARRKQIEATYRSGLGDLAGVSFMPRADENEPNFWLTCVTIEPDAFGAEREQIRLALERHDIESRPTWKPLHLQPAFEDAQFVGPGACEEVFEKGLCLPSGSAMTKSQLEMVIETIRSLHRP